MKARLMVLVAVVVLVSLGWAADDPFAGTWMLNVQKSTFAEGLVPTSGVTNIQAQDNGQICKSDTNYGQWVLHAEYSVKYDGKDYPTTGSTLFDTVSIRRVAANSLEYVWKKDGTEMAKWEYVISEDGKTATANTKTVVEGNTVSQVMIFEKQ